MSEIILKSIVLTLLPLFCLLAPPIRASKSFPLPSYLAPLPASDPDFAALYSSGSLYALGAPGEGDLALMQVRVMHTHKRFKMLVGGVQVGEQVGHSCIDS